MDLYQKIKQKIADELETGDAPPEVDEDFEEDEGEYLDVDALKAEVRQLKQHLRSNYAVYVKRLDKRKTKIKELDEYAKLVLRDNESLNSRLQEAEGYKVQLAETREQLEQLEGFQNQELAKVKHMLLSTETALELEKKQRRRTAETSEANMQTDPIEPVIIHVGDNQDLATELAQSHAECSKWRLEAESMQTQVAAFKMERDYAKTSLLEIEIAGHEQDQSRQDEVNSLKLEVARLQTEKETLEVTLARRDSEIKSKKEECRQETEKSGRAQEAASTLETEVSSLKSTISERLMKLRDVQKENDGLAIVIDSLKSDLKDKEATVSDLNIRLNKLSSIHEQVVKEKTVAEATVQDLRKDCGNLEATVDRLTHEVCGLQQTVADLQEKVTSANFQACAIAEEKSKLERSIPDLIEQSECVQLLRTQVISAEEEVAEKKKAVKLLQSRLNDMKKMLQKELKTAPEPSLATTRDVVVNGQTAIAPQPRETKPNPVNEEAALLFPMDDQPRVDVNVKYLKHVIFKFLTSREYEAKQMTRAVATLLHFSQEEEKVLQEHLDWKMSWFGSRPKLGLGQFVE